MHVLQIVPRYFPNIGGVEIVVQKISETLVQRGIRATIYTVDMNPDLPRVQNINGVLVKRFISLLGDPFYLPEPRFVAALRLETADIIHVHNVHILQPFVAVLFKNKGQKLVLQPHYHRFGQTPLRDALLKLYRYNVNEIVFPRVNLAIANSAYEKRILLEDFSKCKNPILIPEGMEIDEVRQVKHAPVTPKRILYVGALRNYKNVDKVIKGFALLVKKSGPVFRLVIVGKGPEHKSLVDLVDHLGIASFVEWKHDLPREQLLSEYAKASVFILLSYLESFSRAVYDALLINVPVVVLNYGPLETLINARLAEGVSSLGPQEVADALLKAMNRTCVDAADVTGSFLDWPEYADRLIRAYNDLLKQQ